MLPLTVATRGARTNREVEVGTGEAWSRDGTRVSAVRRTDRKMIQSTMARAIAGPTVRLIGVA